MKTYFYTSELARAGGVHPNTVRRYTERGLLPPVQRAANGYRLYTERHLDCLRVVAAIFTANYASNAFRQSASAIIRSVVADDWGGALERAYAHLALTQAERAQAETAALLLERWATGMAADATERPIQIGQVARLLGATIDMLRNWERNGLIDIPRDPANGYRRYGSAEIGRLRVIRMLARAGYSQAAILRMLLQLDRGETTNLRRALDTPRPDEDVYLAADRWLSALAEQEQRARAAIALIEEILQKRAARSR